VAVKAWRAFFERLMSLETARFILALLALCFATGAVFLLMTGRTDIDSDKETIVTFALGQLFTLATLAFNRYFGRADNEQASGRIDDPVNVTPTPKPPRQPLPNPTFGQADTFDGEQQ
jgi:hypothetical protein